MERFISGEMYIKIIIIPRILHINSLFTRLSVVEEKDFERFEKYKKAIEILTGTEEFR